VRPIQHLPRIVRVEQALVESFRGNSAKRLTPIDPAFAARSAPTLTATQASRKRRAMSELQALKYALRLPLP
jgi:hypothetical protein